MDLLTFSKASTLKSMIERHRDVLRKLRNTNRLDKKQLLFIYDNETYYENYYLDSDESRCLINQLIDKHQLLLDNALSEFEKL